MAYDKLPLVDEIVDADGNVVQAGTPLNKALLDHVQDGIVSAHEGLDGLSEDVAAVEKNVDILMAGAELVETAVPEVPIAELEKYFIEADGSMGYSESTDTLTGTGNYWNKLIVYKVTAGNTYIYRGTNIMASAANRVLMAFYETMPGSGVAATEIIVAADAENKPTAFDGEWECTQNGHIGIAAYNWWAAKPLGLFTPSYINIAGKTKLKIQVFGDSISSDTWGDMSSWVNRLQDKMPNHALTIANSAVGGNFLVAYESGELKKGISWQTGLSETTTGIPEDGGFDQYAPIEADADVIVVFAGTNDWNGGSTGIIGDASVLNFSTALEDVPNTTIYGAMRHIIENVFAKAPLCKLLVCTPIQRYNGGEYSTAYNPDDKKPVGEDGQLLNLEGGATLLQVADAIKKSCEYYSVPCLDLCRESGFNRLNFSYAVTNFTDDGLHPNAAGDERLAIMIADKIRAIAG